MAWLPSWSNGGRAEAVSYRTSERAVKNDRPFFAGRPTGWSTMDGANQPRLQ